MNLVVVVNAKVQNEVACGKKTKLLISVNICTSYNVIMHIQVQKVVSGERVSNS